jgi:dolichol kinase
VNRQEAAQLEFQGEIYRKLLHLLAMAYPVGYLIVPAPWNIRVLVLLSLSALLLDVLRSRNAATHRFFERFFGFMMRGREREVLGNRPVFNGATWVTVSFTLLILLFPADVAIVSFALFMFGDAAAALIGRRFGRTAWLRKGASLEGSAAFLAAGLLVAGLLLSGILPGPSFPIPWGAAAGACVAATLLEAAPLPMNDNLAAPLGAAMAMTGIMSMLI